MPRMAASDHLLAQLQEWYLRQCDGDWEHSYGVRLGTLDNPGWDLQIDLAETSLREKAFERLKVERSEHDWLHCWVEDKQFNAACGSGAGNQTGTSSSACWRECHELAQIRGATPTPRRRRSLRSGLSRLASILPEPFASPGRLG
jgi:Immunity protein 53